MLHGLLRAARRRRRGFLFTMPLMLGMGVIMLAAMIAISQVFVTVGGPAVPDLLSDMPTLFEYEGGRRVPEGLPLLSGPPGPELAESHPSLAMYGLTVQIAFGIFAVLLMLAGVSYFFEEMSLVRPGTAQAMAARMAVLAPLYLALPLVWDTAALLIESSSLYLMDPFGGDPHGRAARLWCMMGSAACTVGGTTVDPVDAFGEIGAFDRGSALSLDSWSEALQSPLAGEGFAVNVLLALFKGFAVMFMTAMMFVLSAVRVVLTEVVVVSFPLVTAVGLIPWINTSGISDMFQRNLVGLSVAPLLSAVVLSVGISAIDSQDVPPLRAWFQMLSVGFLAVFFPVMLSPMLGSLSSKVGEMVSTSIRSATSAGSAGLQGAARGAAQASEGLESAARGVPSALMGSSASVPLGERVRMYAGAGAAGMLGGLGSGILSSSAARLGAGAAGASAMASAAGEGARGMGLKAGGRAMAAEAARAIGPAPSPEPPRVSGATLMNPAVPLASLEDGSVDAGMRLAGDPEGGARLARAYSGRPKVSREEAREMSKIIGANPAGAARLLGGK